LPNPALFIAALGSGQGFISVRSLQRPLFRVTKMILQEDYPVFGAFPKLSGTRAVDEIILVRAKRAPTLYETPVSIYRARSAEILAFAIRQHRAAYLAKMLLFLISRHMMHRTIARCDVCQS